MLDLSPSNQSPVVGDSSTQGNLLSLLRTDLLVSYHFKSLIIIIIIISNH